MGLIDKATNKTTINTNEQMTQLNLTIPEYEFLFGLIKNATFKGEHLQIIYSLTVKLQEQYMKLKG
jgi:hypothetical protein